MTPRYGLLFTFHVLFLYHCAQADWEWKASDKTAITDVGFEQYGEAHIAQHEDALCIETNREQSAWIEIPVVLETPGAPFAIEVEAASNAERGACAIQLNAGPKGVSVWLWDGTHVRIATDGKNNHVYTQVDVTEPHVYRLEVEGVHVRVYVDDRLLFSEQLDEPLHDARFQIGDVTEGGAQTRIFRVELKGSSPGGSGDGENSRWQVWKGVTMESGTRSSEIHQQWPSGADALLVGVIYRAADPRQGQIFLLCEGPFGKKLSSAATSHTSISSGINDFRKEMFLLRVPAETKSIRLLWEAETSAIPFAMRELSVMPVRILTGTNSFERSGGLSNVPVGQTFSLPENAGLAGLVVPLTRSFDHAAQMGRLRCQVMKEDMRVADWELAAAEVPRDFFGAAVFMGSEPVPVGQSGRFLLESGIREPMFFGWYQYESSWANPYPGGNFLNGNREEKHSDMTFTAFALLPYE